MPKQKGAKEAPARAIEVIPAARAADKEKDSNNNNDSKKKKKAFKMINKRIMVLYSENKLRQTGEDKEGGIKISETGFKEDTEKIKFHGFRGILRGANRKRSKRVISKEHPNTISGENKSRCFSLPRNTSNTQVNTQIDATDDKQKEEKNAPIQPVGKITTILSPSGQPEDEPRNGAKSIKCLSGTRRVIMGCQSAPITNILIQKSKTLKNINASAT